MNINIYIYIYIYIYSCLDKTYKNLIKLYFNVSGHCPFVKNKNYKIEDAPYIHRIIVLILDKGAAPQNVEIKFYKIFKSFILAAIDGFETWDKDFFHKIH